MTKFILPVTINDSLNRETFITNAFMISCNSLHLKLCFKVSHSIYSERLTLYILQLILHTKSIISC